MSGNAECNTCLKCGRYSDELKFGKEKQLGFLILKKMYLRLFFVLFMQMCRNFAWPWKFTKILFSSLFMEMKHGNYLFKFNSRSTRKRCGICSQLTIKTSKRRHWRPVVFDVNCEPISHLFSGISSVDYEHVFFCWVFPKKLLRLVKLPLTSPRNHKPLLKTALSQEMYLVQRLQSIGSYQKFNCVWLFN